jgi:demethylmenaquinone methyltransferase/2-methoxy-6-polyprenyl-1,4-benzoquinol methylase
LTRLSSAFDSPGAKRRYNRRLFGTIAGRYDLITVLLSYGRDRAWKRQVVARIEPRPGEVVVDLACGTGDIAQLARAGGARVVGVDLAEPMLRRARERQMQPADRTAEGTSRPIGPQVLLVQGDMCDLPLRDGCADAVTSGYGLRNVPVLDEALAEILRILRPGGRFVALDFNRPSNRVLRSAYLAYLTVVGSALGLALHGDADTYRYIAASLRRYPGAPAVAETMTRTGFVDARWTPVLGGLMAIHEGRRGPGARS